MLVHCHTLSRAWLHAVFALLPEGCKSPAGSCCSARMLATERPHTFCLQAGAYLSSCRLASS